MKGDSMKFAIPIQKIRLANRLAKENLFAGFLKSSLSFQLFWKGLPFPNKWKVVCARNN